MRAAATSEPNGGELDVKLHAPNATEILAYNIVGIEPRKQYLPGSNVRWVRHVEETEIGKGEQRLDRRQHPMYQTVDPAYWNIRVIHDISAAQPVRLVRKDVVY